MSAVSQKGKRFHVPTSLMLGLALLVVIAVAISLNTFVLRRVTAEIAYAVPTQVAPKGFDTITFYLSDGKQVPLFTAMVSPDNKDYVLKDKNVTLLEVINGRTPVSFEKADQTFLVSATRNSSGGRHIKFVMGQSEVTMYLHLDDGFLVWLDKTRRLLIWYVEK